MQRLACAAGAPSLSDAAPRYRPADIAADSEAPPVIHQPVSVSLADKPLVITAEVRDPSGIKWVRLRYRSVNQYQDFRTLPMLPTGERDQFRAVIPTEHMLPTWDLMYFIEAMDQKGNGTMHPDFNQAAPYIIVKLQR